MGLLLPGGFLRRGFLACAAIHVDRADGAGGVYFARLAFLGTVADSRGLLGLFLPDNRHKVAFVYLI